MNRTWIRRCSASARAALWLSAWVLISMLINLLATPLLGNIQNWSAWLQAHTTALLIWRLGLYAVLIYGWCWIRARLLQRQPEATQRLYRAEGAGVAALVLLEVSHALTGSEAL